MKAEKRYKKKNHKNTHTNKKALDVNRRIKSEGASKQGYRFCCCHVLHFSMFLQSMWSWEAWASFPGPSAGWGSGNEAKKCVIQSNCRIKVLNSALWLATWLMLFQLEVANLSHYLGGSRNNWSQNETWDLGSSYPGTNLSLDQPVLGPTYPGTNLSSAPQRCSWATSKKKVVYSAEVQAFDEPPWWERNCGAMQRENPTFRHILWSIIAVNTQ